MSRERDLLAAFVAGAVSAAAVGVALMKLERPSPLLPLVKLPRGYEPHVVRWYRELEHANFSESQSDPESDEELQLWQPRTPQSVGRPYSPFEGA